MLRTSLRTATPSIAGQIFQQGVAAEPACAATSMRHRHTFVQVHKVSTFEAYKEIALQDELALFDRTNAEAIVEMEANAAKKEAKAKKVAAAAARRCKAAAAASASAVTPQAKVEVMRCRRKFSKATGCVFRGMSSTPPQEPVCHQSHPRSVDMPGRGLECNIQSIFLNKLL